MKVMMRSGIVAIVLMSGCAQVTPYSAADPATAVGKTAQEIEPSATTNTLAVEVLPSPRAPAAIEAAPLFQTPKPKPPSTIQSGNDFNFQAGGNQ